MQEDIAIIWGPLNSIIVRGKLIDICAMTINRMLHGPQYTTLVLFGLFEGKHHEVTSDTTKKEQNSREGLAMNSKANCSRCGECSSG